MPCRHRKCFSGVGDIFQCVGFNNRFIDRLERPDSAGRICVLFVYMAQGIYRKRRKNGVSGIIFEYFLKIRRKRLNICADLCYTYNVVYSASEEYILAVSGNNIVNNTP